MSLRDRSCTPKRKYFSDEAAATAKAAAESREPSTTVRVYRCQFCRARHLTSANLDTFAKSQIRAAAIRARKD